MERPKLKNVKERGCDENCEKMNQNVNKITKRNILTNKDNKRYYDFNRWVDKKNEGTI